MMEHDSKTIQILQVLQEDIKIPHDRHLMMQIISQIQSQIFYVEPLDELVANKERRIKGVNVVEALQEEE